MQPETDPDPDWVRELTGCTPAAADRLLAEAGAQQALFRGLARAHALYGRRSYVEIDAPLELYAIARYLRPRCAVEVGVSSGVSSAYLLAALRKNRRGVLHSIDLPRPARTTGRPTTSSWSLPTGTESGWAIPSRLRPRWRLHLGDKRDLVPQLGRELREVGLFVYDVPHNDSTVMEEFRAIDRRMGPGAVAIVDHGPSGSACPVLRRWAKRRGARAVGRSGLGLYAFAAGVTAPVAASASRPG